MSELMVVVVFTLLTVTLLLLQSLLPSLPSSMSSLGSTEQLPPLGLVNVPAADGVAVKRARKVPGLVSMVTVPLAVQVSSPPPLMEQMMSPVMPVC